MARLQLMISLVLLLCSDYCCHGFFFKTKTTASAFGIPKKTANITKKNLTIPEWRKALPDPLPQRRTLELIHIPLSPKTQVTVYLLGTSHVSNSSCTDVRILLNATKPDVVFLELCPQRIPMLAPKEKQEPSIENTNMTFWETVNAVQQGGSMSRGSAIGTVLLTRVQDDYADSLGVDLGGEFQAAWEYCQSARPICILGDRPLRITVMRAWESLGWWGKTKCLIALLWSALRRPNPEEIRAWMDSILEGDSDVLTESMAELGDAFPSLERVILKERDAYLACKLYQTTRYLARDRNHTLVAIVGAGHGKGMCQWLTDGNGKTPEEILRDIVQVKSSTPQEVESLVQQVDQLPYNHGVF